MPITKRIYHGVKQLKNWTISSINDTKESLKSWCDGRFALLGHKHTVTDISGLTSHIPNYNIMSTGYTTLMHVYETPADGWLYVTGFSGGGCWLCYGAIRDCIGGISEWDASISYAKYAVVKHNGYPYQASKALTGVEPPAAGGNGWNKMLLHFPIFTIPIASHTASSDSGYGHVLLPCKKGTTCMLGGCADNGNTTTFNTSNSSGRIRFISTDGIYRELNDTGDQVPNNVHTYSVLVGRLAGL